MEEIKEKPELVKKRTIRQSDSKRLETAPSIEEAPSLSISQITKVKSLITNM